MSPREEDDLDTAKSRTGRFFVVPHRGGTRVEVSEPIHCGGDAPWMCAVKLVGRKRDQPPPGESGESEADATQTLLVRTGRGNTPEEAQRNAMAQLTLVYGTPVDPPPSPTILQKKTDPPPPPDPPPSKPPPDRENKPGFFQRLFGRRK